MHLAEGFVKDDACGGGEVEAAHLARRHGNAQGLRTEALHHLLGQAIRLPAEDQAVAGAIVNLCIEPLPTGAVAEEAFQRSSRPRPARFEVGKRGVAIQLHGVPVVQAGAAQGALVQAKTKATDEMQCRPRGRAQPGDVARVRRDFRFPENDVQHGGQTRWPTGAGLYA